LESNQKSPLDPPVGRFFKITEESADQEAVKKAYHKFALRLHPDKLRNDPQVTIKTEAFKLIQAAYDEIFKEKEWRK
jgi:curved DNA-binding protein CbpA